MSNANPALNLRAAKERAETTDWFEVLATESLSTATRTSQQFDNPGRNGMLMYVKTANEAGTASFTPVLKMYGPNGDALTLWTAASAITANGTYVYEFFPSDPSDWGASITEAVGIVIPRKWFVVLTYSGTPASDKIDTEVHVCYI